MRARCSTLTAKGGGKDSAGLALATLGVERKALENHPAHNHLPQSTSSSRLLAGRSEPRNHELFVSVRRISIQPRPRLNQRQVRLCPIGARIIKNRRDAFGFDQNLITNNSHHDKPCLQILTGITDLTEGERSRCILHSAVVLHYKFFRSAAGKRAPISNSTAAAPVIGSSRTPQTTKHLAAKQIICPSPPPPRVLALDLSRDSAGADPFMSNKYSHEV